MNCLKEENEKVVVNTEEFGLFLKKEKEIQLKDLIKAGFITKKQSKFLLKSIINKNKSIVIIGNMCSGKTTLLRAIVEKIKEIDKERNIINGNKVDKRLLISPRIIDKKELIYLDDIEKLDTVKEVLNKTCCICTGYKANYLDNYFIDNFNDINKPIIVVELDNKFNSPKKVLKCYELNK